MCKKSAVGVKLSQWLPSSFLCSNFSIKYLHTSDLKQPQFHKLCSFSRFWFISYFWSFCLPSSSLCWTRSRCGAMFVLSAPHLHFAVNWDTASPRNWRGAPSTVSGAQLCEALPLFSASQKTCTYRTEHWDWLTPQHSAYCPLQCHALCLLTCRNRGVEI